MTGGTNGDTASHPFPRADLDIFNFFVWLRRYSHWDPGFISQTCLPRRFLYVFMPSLRQLPLLTLFLGLRFRELDERALWDGDGLDGIGV